MNAEKKFGAVDDSAAHAITCSWRKDQTAPLNELHSNEYNNTGTSDSLNFILANPNMEWHDLREYMKGKNVCTNAALREALKKDAPKTAVHFPQRPRRRRSSLILAPIEDMFRACTSSRKLDTSNDAIPSKMKSKHSDDYVKEVIAERIARGTIERRSKLDLGMRDEKSFGSDFVFCDGRWVDKNKAKRANKPWVEMALQQLNEETSSQDVSSVSNPQEQSDSQSVATWPLGHGRSTHMDNEKSLSNGHTPFSARVQKSFSSKLLDVRLLLEDEIMHDSRE